MGKWPTTLITPCGGEKKENEKNAGQSLTITTANTKSTVVMDATVRFLLACTSQLNRPTYHRTAIAVTATRHH